MRKNFIQRLSGKFHRTFFNEQWQLLYEFADELKLDHAAYKKLSPPRDRFWADPFIVFRDDVYYLFFEELRFAQDKGYISVMELTERGVKTGPRVVLERPYHLSYPFLFQWQGRDYMIPETMDAGIIEVYECVEFPNQWRRLKTLIANIRAVDTTLFQGQDRWWMFCNVAEGPADDPFAKLFLFHAPDPLSAHWQPHPLNPVVNDARASRPGGNLFEREGELIRVTHDCGPDTGRGVRLKKIVTLTEREYREEEIAVLQPSPGDGLLRIHTLNRQNRMTVIDGLRRISKWP